MTFIESEEVRSWPEAAQNLVRNPWFIYIAKKNRMFWEGEPKRIYEAALSNGWKEAKLGKSMSWEGEDIDMRHFELCAAKCAHNCDTRQSCRLVTIETLITILTIENLNS